MVASSMNLFFEDELQGLSHLHKNMICGSITGAIYKSTKPVTAMTGFLIGGALIGTMTKVVEELN